MAFTLIPTTVRYMAPEKMVQSADRLMAVQGVATSHELWIDDATEGWDLYYVQRPTEGPGHRLAEWPMEPIEIPTWATKSQSELMLIQTLVLAKAQEQALVEMSD